MPAQRPILIMILASLSLVLAGCTSPDAPGASVDAPKTPTVDDSVTTESVSGSTGSVGGSVKNSAPTVPTFTPSATEGENRGSFVVIFTGTIRDANTEKQIKNISVTGTGPQTLSSSHEVMADEVNALTEPASFGGDGFKVWTGTKNDGILNFKYQQTFTAFIPAGAYTFKARGEDTPHAVGLSGSVVITITAFSDITISPTPVAANGSALPGQNWGQWEAEAGATNVASTNYIKLVNTGDTASARVVIDFADSFVGATDSNFTVGVANNVQFAFFEDTTPGTTAPNEGTYSYLAANADGTVTVQFSAKNNVIYVSYQIVQLPAILPVQAYGISYTVTEL